MSLFGFQQYRYLIKRLLYVFAGPLTFMLRCLLVLRIAGGLRWNLMLARARPCGSTEISASAKQQNLRTKLLTQLETGAPILIDARQLTAMDAGIAQLLISARASAIPESLDFTLIGNEVVLGHSMPARHSADDDRSRVADSDLQG